MDNPNVLMLVRQHFSVEVEAQQQTSAGLVHEIYKKIRKEKTPGSHTRDYSINLLCAHLRTEEAQQIPTACLALCQTQTPSESETSWD